MSSHVTLQFAEEDRTVAERWEGDLISGLNRSGPGMLVERPGRFTMLVACLMGKATGYSWLAP